MTRPRPRHSIFIRRPTPRDDLPPSLGERDLREAFDLPLVSGSARDMERHDGADAGRADAAALFEDRPARRKPTAAELRSQARRCITCGSGVPKGMSICSVCGTDQETGLRVGLADDLAPPPPPAPSGPPLHVSLVGGLCITGSLILLILAVIQSTKTESSIELLSWLAWDSSRSTASMRRCNSSAARPPSSSSSRSPWG